MVTFNVDAAAWRWVPVEANYTMVTAGRRAYRDGGLNAVSETWAAMLAAAPRPPIADLAARLEAHARIHDEHVPHDAEQARWAADLRAAAAVVAHPPIAQPTAEDVVCWWNGIPEGTTDESDVASYSAREDTNHDIPLYAGWNEASETVTRLRSRIAQLEPQAAGWRPIDLDKLAADLVQALFDVARETRRGPAWRIAFMHGKFMDEHMGSGFGKEPLREFFARQLRVMLPPLPEPPKEGA